MSRPRHTITRQQMLDGIEAEFDANKRTSMSVLLYESPAQMRVTGTNGERNPWWIPPDERADPKVTTTVVKVQRIQVPLGAKYESSVNRQIKRAGLTDRFRSGPRRNGIKRVRWCLPIARHANSGHHYLDTSQLDCLQVEYRDTSTGQRIDKVDLKPWSTERHNASRRRDRKLNEHVRWRDYRADRIVEITFRGATYVITEPGE